MSRLLIACLLLSTNPALPQKVSNKVGRHCKSESRAVVRAALNYYADYLAVNSVKRASARSFPRDSVNQDHTLLRVVRCDETLSCNRIYRLKREACKRNRTSVGLATESGNWGYSNELTNSRIVERILLQLANRDVNTRLRVTALYPDQFQWDVRSSISILPVTPWYVDRTNARIGGEVNKLLQVRGNVRRSHKIPAPIDKESRSNGDPLANHFLVFRIKPQAQDRDYRLRHPTYRRGINIARRRNPRGSRNKKQNNNKSPFVETTSSAAHLWSLNPPVYNLNRQTLRRRCSRIQK